MRKLLLLLIPFFLFAEVTLNELKTAPSGIVRNFHIWMYLQQDINSTQADEAYALKKGYNGKITKLYRKKSKTPIKSAGGCAYLTNKQLLTSKNLKCVDRWMSPKRGLKLTPAQRNKVAYKLRKSAPKTAAWLRAMAKKNKNVTAALHEGIDAYMTLAVRAGRKYRQRVMNQRLSANSISKLSTHKNFTKFIKYCVTDPNMNEIHQSLLFIEPKNTLSYQTYIFLGVNALNYKHLETAKKFFKLALDKATYRSQRDKARLFTYLITKDDKVLTTISESIDINIYSLYAKEIKEVDVTNYFTTVDMNTSADFSYDISDPYNYTTLLKEARTKDLSKVSALADKFTSPKYEAIQAYLRSKASGYTELNYIMPYKEATKDYTTVQKALLYAIARQESYFLPNAMSHCFALGMMQIMPFNVKNIAKAKKDEFDLMKMFKPKHNIPYAQFLLRDLKRKVYHPLFIAYAYNGGLGLTSRHIKQRGMFKRGRYEPFLSLELMGVSETREYGKKVLANYYMYKMILGEKLSIVTLLKDLTIPSKTDSYKR